MSEEARYLLTSETLEGTVDQTKFFFQQSAEFDFCLVKWITHHHEGNVHSSSPK